MGGLLRHRPLSSRFSSKIWVFFLTSPLCGLVQSPKIVFDHKRKLVSSWFCPVPVFVYREATYKPQAHTLPLPPQPVQPARVQPWGAKQLQKPEKSVALVWKLRKKSRIASQLTSIIPEITTPHVSLNSPQKFIYSKARETK